MSRKRAQRADAWLDSLEDEKLPRPLGRYELLDILAIGGMAILYTARVVSGPDLGRRLVIKRIHPGLAADSQFTTMFADEARICSQLDHPRVVEVFELGQVDGELFIAMELVDGIDLLELLRASVEDGLELPARLSAYILCEVLDGLAYAHGATDDLGRPLAIIHRDVSPGNVLLSKRGHVKLADFGIARATANDSRTMTGTLKGKYSYMSPEQVGGEDVDNRSDLFSAGIVLTELLIGRRLFVAPGDYEILLMVREVRLDRLEKYGGHLDPALRGILDRALQRHPDDRFQSAVDFRDALGDWLRGQPQRVTAEHVATRVRQIASGEAAIPVLDDDRYHAVGPDTLREIEAAAQNTEAARAEYEQISISQPAEETFARGTTEVEGPIEYTEIETDHRQWESEPGPRLPTIPEEGFRFAGEDAWDLHKVPPLRLLYELAIHDATGVLAAEVSMLKKRLYVVGGRPVHMESNVASEELGEMLVARNMVSSGELMMAQAVLSRFDNVLERALVELSLIEPRALLAELEAQLKQSVAEVCTWTKGSATWTPSVRSPTRPKVAPLALLPILVVGAEQIDRGFLEDWARSLADATVHTIDEPPVDPARFGAGAKLAQIRSMCGDGRSMTEIRSYCPSDAAWIDTLRIVYLLAQTGLIYFGMPV